MSTTIASRTFELDGVAEPYRVTIKVEMPESTPNGGFRCQCEIDLNGTNRNLAIMGEDSLQALLLALRLAAGEVDRAAKKVGGEVPPEWWSDLSRLASQG